jgi:hypothetical protein
MNSFWPNHIDHKVEVLIEEKEEDGAYLQDPIY